MLVRESFRASLAGTGPDDLTPLELADDVGIAASKAGRSEKYGARGPFSLVGHRWSELSAVELSCKYATEGPTWGENAFLYFAASQPTPRDAG
jgi:hypothetical protein